MIRQFPGLSSLVAVMLLVSIGIVIYMVRNVISGIPVSISRVEHKPLAGVSANFPDHIKEHWAAMSFGAVTITNISKNQKVALELFLHLTPTWDTKHQTIRIPADLRGPADLIFGRDDSYTKMLAERGQEPAEYFQSPVELDVGQTVRKTLVFLLKFSPDRVSDFMPKQQDFDLEVRDLISGRTALIHIPGRYRGDNYD